MFSWLNFEELLIHNPIQLINPSEDIISVAMNKKQYIDFFSNKYTYNGLYYDEAMDFCLFYYADPLQSSKNGDMYAGGYIDVDMKIYRVKWLCNVSIKRPFANKTAVSENGLYTHTAYAYSSDGTDRFSTVYPNLNLLDGTKDFSGSWASLDSWQNDGTYKGLTVKKRTGQWFGTYKIFTAPKDGSYTFSAYIKSSGSASNVIRYGVVNNTSSQNIIEKQMGNNFDWTRDSITLSLKANDNVVIKYAISGAGTDSILWTAGHKWEPGSTATPYMPSASEVTTADWPNYIGQYKNYSTEDSKDPASYEWSKIQNTWNVNKTEMIVNETNKTIITVLNGAIAKSTPDTNITGWQSLPPNGNYNYVQPTYSLDVTGDDFIISGYGLRGLKNG